MVLKISKGKKPKFVEIVRHDQIKITAWFRKKTVGWFGGNDRQTKELEREV